MSIKLEQSTKAILLDIEGTTTPIDFVYKVLFPFARDHVEEFLIARASDENILQDIAALCEEHQSDKAKGLNPPPLQASSPAHLVINPRQGTPDVKSLTNYFHWLMDKDRKSTPLKSIQGRIWMEGYGRGELRSQVFDDVPRAFSRWRAADKRLYIYSSGSVLAQKLLFGNTDVGNLTEFIDDYFDTTIGAKVEPGSYSRIAGIIGDAPSDIVFISDSVAELVAARASGLRSLLCIRPGNRAQAGAEAFDAIHSFDEL